MTQQQQQRSRTLSSGAALPNKPFHVPRMSGPPPPAAASKSTLTTVPSSATKVSDRLRKLLLELQQAKLASHLPKQAGNDAVYAQWREILPKLETVDVATLVSFTKAQSLEMLRVVQMSKKGLDAIYVVLSKKAVSADDDLEDWQIVLDWLEGVVELALKPKPKAKTSPVNPYASPSRQSLAALAAAGGADVVPRQPGGTSQSQDLPRARSEGAPSPARNDQDRLQKLSAPRSSGPNGLLSGAATELEEEEQDLRERDDEIGGPPQSHLGDLLLPPPAGKQAPWADVPSDAITSDGGDDDKTATARVDKGKGRYVSPRDLQQAPPPDESDDDEQLSPPSNTLKPFGNGFNGGTASLTAIGGVGNGSDVDMEDDDEANAFLRYANDNLPTSAQQAGPSRAATAPPAHLGLSRPDRESDQGLFAPDPQANDGGLADAEVDMLASDDDQLEYADPAPQQKKGKQPIRRARPAKKKAVEVNPDGKKDQLASQEGTGAEAAAGVEDASASETNGAGRPRRQSKTDAANKLGALDWSRRVPKKPTQVPASTARGGRGSSTQPAPSKKKGKKVERAYTSSEDELEEDKPKKSAVQKGKRRAPASPARSDSEEPAPTQRKSKRSRPTGEPANSKRKVAKAGSSNSSKAKPTRALKQKDANVKASQAKPRASSVAASQAKKPKVEPRERREGTRKSSRASIQTGTMAAAAASQAMTPEAGFKPGEIGYVVNQTMSSKCWPALILRVRADRVRIAVLPGRAADASAVPKFRDVASTLQSGPPITLERDDPPLLESRRSVALAFAMNFLEDRPRFRAWKNAAINADGSAQDAAESSDEDEDEDDGERAGIKLSEGEEEEDVAVDDDDESE